MIYLNVSYDANCSQSSLLSFTSCTVLAEKLDPSATLPRLRPLCSPRWQFWRRNCIHILIRRRFLPIIAPSVQLLGNPSRETTSQYWYAVDCSQSASLPLASQTVLAEDTHQSPTRRRFLSIASTSVHLLENPEGGTTSNTSFTVDCTHSTAQLVLVSWAVLVEDLQAKMLSLPGMTIPNPNVPQISSNRLTFGSALGKSWRRNYIEKGWVA